MDRCVHKNSVRTLAALMLAIVTAALTTAMVPLQALPLVATAQAQTVYTITVSGVGDDHEFEAYQVFAGSIETGADLVPRLMDVSWGDGVDTTPVERDYGDAAEKYAELEGVGSTAMSTFARELVAGGYLKSEVACRSVFNGDQSQGVIAGLEPGCYLVKDVDGSGEGKEGFAYMPYVLRVCADTDIRCAAEAPVLVKKVQDASDGVADDDWSVTAQMAVPARSALEDAPAEKPAPPGEGDAGALGADGTPSEAASVAVRLVAQLPANLADYEAYPLAFYDWLPQGMDLAAGSAVSVTVAGQALAEVPVPERGGDYGASGVGASVAGVSVDLTGTSYGAAALAEAPDAVAGASVDVDRASDGRTLAVSLDDVRSLGAVGGDAVTVEYLASVQGYEGADRSYAGLAYLSYANDPNAGGSQSRGVTAPKAAAVTVHVTTADEAAAAELATTQATDDVRGVAALIGRAVVVFALAILTAGAIVGRLTRENKA